MERFFFLSPEHVQIVKIIVLVVAISFYVLPEVQPTGSILSMSDHGSLLRTFRLIFLFLLMWSCQTA